MSAFREPSFKERQDAAAKAKQAALEKLRARPRPGGPAFVQQQADRVSRATEQATAKEARAAETAQKKARAAEQKPTRDQRYAARKTRGK